MRCTGVLLVFVLLAQLFGVSHQRPAGVLAPRQALHFAQEGSVSPKLPNPEGSGARSSTGVSQQRPESVLTPRDALHYAQEGSVSPKLSRAEGSGARSSTGTSQQSPDSVLAPRTALYYAQNSSASSKPSKPEGNEAGSSTGVSQVSAEAVDKIMFPSNIQDGDEKPKKQVLLDERYLIKVPDAPCPEERKEAHGKDCREPE